MTGVGEEEVVPFCRIVIRTSVDEVLIPHHSREPQRSSPRAVLPLSPLAVVAEVFFCSVLVIGEIGCIIFSNRMMRGPFHRMVRVLLQQFFDSVRHEKKR